MAFRARGGTALAWVAATQLLGNVAVAADDALPTVGDATDALPGLHRVPVAGTGEARLSVAGSLGYGLTEAQPSENGEHHRVVGGLAVAGAPLPWLELGVDSLLRHDVHPDDGMGTDDGTVFEVTANARGGVMLQDRWAVGGALAFHLPGADEVGDAFANPALEARALAAFTPPEGPLVVAAAAGFRADFTGGLAPAPPQTFRLGDRIASGLSDSHAVLVGIGAAYRIGSVDLLGEWSADFLVGDEAPEVGQSPIRASLGGRYHFTRRLSAQLLADVTLSGRPPLGASDPLVPIEPRFTLLGAVTYRLFDAADRLPPPAESQPTEPAPAEPVPPVEPVAPAIVTGSIEVNVFTSEGHPLSDATVEVRAGDETRGVPHSNMQTYRIDDVPVGKVVVTVRAERLRDQSLQLDLAEGPPLSVEVRMQKALPTGQVRGLVRSFGGEGVVARIDVASLSDPDAKTAEVHSDADGRFSVDVAPGRYRVEIHADGFVTQRREVVVERDGVTILNADLRKAAP